MWDLQISPLRGLGEGKDSNTELNLIHGDGYVIDALELWFKNIWNESEEYRDELITIIENSQPMIKTETKGWTICFSTRTVQHNSMRNMMIFIDLKMKFFLNISK